MFFIVCVLQVAHACWRPGEPAPYLHLALTFAAMDATTKRLRIADALTNMFRCAPIVKWGMRRGHICITCMES